MNLRQRILSGHLLLTGLLVAVSLYGIHRQRAASIIRQQAINSGQDLAFTQLLNRQVDEYFKLCRLVEETHDNDFRVAADRLLEEAKPLYRRLRSSIADPADRTRPKRYEELDQLFAWPEGRQGAGSPEGQQPSARGAAPAPGREGAPEAATASIARGGPPPGAHTDSAGTGEKVSEDDPLAKRALAEMSSMYTVLENHLAGEALSAEISARGTDRAILVVLLILAPLAIVSTFLVIRSIRSALNRLMEATETVARGKFNIHLPVTGKDEISRLSRAFNEMSAELEKARRLEADFLAIASHELRTPLTCILAYTHKVRAALPGTAQNPEAAEYLDRIGKEVDHLVGKTSDLLALGVIEAGQLKLRRREFMTRGFLLMTAGSFRPLAVERGVEFEIEISPHLPTTFVADPDRLEQVLLSLLDNAFKFTPAGGRVGFHADLQDGSIQIVVRDTGPGIPAERLDSIFEKYSQARTPGASRGGTGLGLAVARGIVQAHGGTIAAHSAPGQGSRFVVLLPIGTRSVQGQEVA